jgi:hypothetical protein
MKSTRGSGHVWIRESPRTFAAERARVPARRGFSGRDSSLLAVVLKVEVRVASVEIPGKLAVSVSSGKV